MGKLSFPLVNIRKKAVNEWNMYHFTGEEKEKIVIPQFSDADGYYAVYLTEIPDSGSVTGITYPPTIDGFTEYRGNPIDSETKRLNFNANEFWINYSTGQIVFHSSNANETKYVDYWAKGSLIEADEINYLYEKILLAESKLNPPEFIEFKILEESKIFELGQEFPFLDDNITFTWTIKNIEYLKEDSIKIENISNNQLLGFDLSIEENEYRYVWSSKIVKNEPGELLFKISAVDINEQTIEAEYIITWQGSIFYGISSNQILNDNEFSNFNSQLTEDVSGDYNYLSGGYKIFAYPSNMEPPNYIIDKTTRLPISFLDSQIITIQNKYGIETEYNFYVSNNILNSDLTIEVK